MDHDGHSFPFLNYATFVVVWCVLCVFFSSVALEDFVTDGRGIREGRR